MLCGVQDNNNNRSSWIPSKGGCGFLQKADVDSFKRRMWIHSGFVQKADVSDLCSAGHIFHCVVGGTTNS